MQFKTKILTVTLRKVSPPPQPSTAAAGAPSKFPHSDASKPLVKFDEDGEPPAAAEDPAKPESDDKGYHWRKGNRPPWQQHSEMGPNIHPEVRALPPVILPDVVNPPDFDYSRDAYACNVEDARAFWEHLKEGSAQYSDPTKTIDALKDDYQQLFVTILMQHAQDVIGCIESGTAPVPLNVFLLGTPGAGNTFCVQTLLQELQLLLTQHQLPASFVRVAAPTGSAAFNIKFNATTTHRLIHWFTPAFFDVLKEGSPALALFQKYMQHTHPVSYTHLTLPTTPYV